jgi:hypothetical protein
MALLISTNNSLGFRFRQFRYIGLRKRFFPMHSIKRLDFHLWLGLVYSPIDAIQRQSDSIGIGSRSIPRQDTTSFAKVTFGCLRAPLIQSRGILQRFFWHVQVKIARGNHHMDVASHVAIGTIAIQSDYLVLVASEFPSNTATVATNGIFFLAVVVSTSISISRPISTRCHDLYYIEYISGLYASCWMFLLLQYDRMIHSLSATPRPTGIIKHVGLPTSSLHHDARDEKLKRSRDKRSTFGPLPTVRYWGRNFRGIIRGDTREERRGSNFSLEYSYGYLPDGTRLELRFTFGVALPVQKVHISALFLPSVVVHTMPYLNIRTINLTQYSYPLTRGGPISSRVAHG